MNIFCGDDDPRTNENPMAAEGEFRRDDGLINGSVSVRHQALITVGLSTRNTVYS
jgi:hypothetical protein